MASGALTNNLPRISFIVVTYNSRETILDCLASIEAQKLRPKEILVVDNDSNDDTVKLVRSNFPDVAVTETYSNRGYGYANNLGASKVSGTIIGIVNPDVILDASWARQMAVALSSDSLRGAAEGKLLQSQDPRRVDVGGSRLNILGFGCTTKHGELDSPEEWTEEVSYPSGAAFVIRRDVYSAVGGFDATYFLYHEDVDLGLRIYAAGWKVVYVPAARAIHRHESGLRPDKLKLLERNRWTTLTKNLPAAYFIRCGLLLGVCELGLLLYLTRAGLVRPKAQAYLEFCRNLDKTLRTRRATQAAARLKNTYEQLMTDDFPTLVPSQGVAVHAARAIQSAYVRAFVPSAMRVKPE
jgi:GT2 family glycosyltransferase